jgi:hypothetical protein
MDEGPKIPKDAVLDPEERLDLLLGHLGACRAGLSEKEPAATSRRVRARCIAVRAHFYDPALVLCHTLVAW